MARQGVSAHNLARELILWAAAVSVVERKLVVRFTAYCFTVHHEYNEYTKMVVGKQHCIHGLAVIIPVPRILS